MRPRILYRITYPLGILLSRLPILTYGLQEINPKKVVWREKYKQGIPNSVWFDRYPNQLPQSIKIGVNSYSADAITLVANAEIDIGNEVRIARGLKIIDKNTAYSRDSKTISKLHIGNNVFIGADAKIMLGGENGSILTICDGAIIGAGSIITKSIKKKGTYVGMPAHLI